MGISQKGFKRTVVELGPSLVTETADDVSTDTIDKQTPNPLAVKAQSDESGKRKLLWENLLAHLFNVSSCRREHVLNILQIRLHHYGAIIQL